MYFFINFRKLTANITNQTHINLYFDGDLHCIFAGLATYMLVKSVCFQKNNVL